MRSVHRHQAGTTPTRRAPTRRARRAAMPALMALLGVAVLLFPSASAGAQGHRSSLSSDTAAGPTSQAQNLHVPAVISELPVPPTVPADGMCTNPTGCVSGNWGALGSPGFYWDSHYVLLGVTYAGAPMTGPASIYNGPQVLLEKTDGSTFAGGDAWKCLTCGVAAGSDVVTGDYTYPPPRALPGDKQVLVGNAILECTSPTGSLYVLSDPRCTTADTHIYPIYWGNTALGATSPTTPFGNGREWRLSPDGVHLAWDNLFISGISFGENEFEGTLSFDPTSGRYNLTDVYFLPQPTPWTIGPNNQLTFTPTAMIGELRGWTSNGQGILGIQSYESDSTDLWATSLATGRSVPLTDHAEYTDPNFMSPNGQWLISEQVKGSGRLDFVSAMEGIAPITGLISTAYVDEMRNNGNRRFFLPWLVNPAAGKSEQINVGGDPNWNAAADPVWLADSTAVVWAENLACGANPTPHQCSDSTEPGGRNSRIMIARFPSLHPSPAIPPKPISNTAPASWAIPYTAGQTLPAATPIPTGTYTLDGNVFGSAIVTITDNSTNTGYQSIAAIYHNYVQYPGLNVINGTESVQNDNTPGNVTWNEDLTSLGQQGVGSKVTSLGGFTVGLSVLFLNNFQATGTMTTTIDGQTYTQPANGA